MKEKDCCGSVEKCLEIHETDNHECRERNSGGECCKDKNKCLPALPVVGGDCPGKEEK